MIYHVRDVLREFLGHNFVSGLRTLLPKEHRLQLQCGYIKPSLHLMT